MAKFDLSPRQDFSELRLSKDALVAVSKQMGKYRHAGEKKAKLEACALCGKAHPDYCNSHSIPQFCLRAIAFNGMVKTTNSSIGMDILPEQVGVNSAGTFRMICRDCDSKYFSDYENPSRYEDSLGLENDLLGKIAVKVCLLEQYKARVQISTFNEVVGSIGGSSRQFHQMEARERDLIDDAFQLDYAREASRGESAGYRVLFDAGLSYTVPIAFQGQVALISDFEGELINNIFNYSADYRIEPLYICVFPLPTGSRVFLFCRDGGYARYAKFHRQLKAQSQGKALNAILKIILAYSEEVYLSPLLPDSVLQDEGFSSLARMNTSRWFNFHLSKKGFLKQVRMECAINDIPNIPELMWDKYSMAHLSERTSIST